MIRGGHATYDFSATTAVVTGAAGDIGRAVAIRLATSGARLSLWDLDAALTSLEQTAEACRRTGAPQVHLATCDVTDETAVRAAGDDVVRQIGVPTCVFNNAGYQGVFAPAPEYPAADAARVLDVNVIGVINVLQTTARLMQNAAVPGSIVNSASMAGVAGAPNMLAYSASKAAVVGLTSAAAQDLAASGIRVNAVSPAFIGPGAMWDRQVELQAAAPSDHYSSDPVRVAEQMIGLVPMRRLGSVDEVAATVVWLLSAEASYLTGTNLLPTGGIR